MNDRGLREEETVTNIGGLFTRAEFTITEKPDVLFLLPDIDVTIVTTTEGVAGGRHHVCVLARLHIVCLLTQARAMHA